MSQAPRTAPLATFAALIGAALAATAAPAAAAGYQVRVLADLGGPGTTANAINNHDDVAGSAMVASDGQQHAVAWRGGHGRPIVIDFDTAVGINDNGTVVVTHHYQGEVYRRGNAPLSMPFDTYPLGIGPQDTVYGSMDNADAMLCTRKGGCMHVGGLPGNFISWVAGINRSNDYVGASFIDPGYEATLWRHTGQVVELPPVYTYAWAEAINDAGVVVGRSFNDAYQTVAVRWIDGQPMVLPADSDIDTDAESLNAFGDAVGRAWVPAANGTHAMLWPMGGGAIDLDAYVGATWKAAGWVLIEAVGINDGGRIVGRLWNAAMQQERGVILVPTP